MSLLDHQATRNPRLWLRHYPGRGMIAGAIRDGADDHVYGKRLRIRNENMARDVYTYGSDLANPDSYWGENFTVSDLRAGDYEIVVLKESGGIASARRRASSRGASHSSTSRWISCRCG